MTSWNYADVLEVVAETVPDAPALTHGERTHTWAALEARANNLSRWLLEHGALRQDKIALYLTNCSEYLEASYAAFKISLVPINTNYRYADDELAYLWENADAVAVVFHATFAERIEAIRDRLPKVRSWLWVDDGSAPCPEWATPYEAAATGGDGSRTVAPWPRSPDDLYMLYTGGTTGMPKGVMWRQDDLFARINGGGWRRYEGGLESVRTELETNGPGVTVLPACPLMHGTGGFLGLEALAEGGRVVTLPRFDAEEVWDHVERQRVNALVIVGDAFAKPLLHALDSEPSRWDISSLFIMVSSGVMWSEETKQGLIAHHEGMLLVDAFGSSEALGMGTSVSSGRSAAKTAKFRLGDGVRVLDEENRDVVPGSGTIGVIALGGRIPLGYYKDETKSQATFRVVDGQRYSIPGDFAEVDEDGTIRLLGRGSVCINTGGEKVFPEEVEEVIKTLPGVHDAVVVGVPSERFGEEVVAVVEGASTEDEVIAAVKARLAGYKAPRRVRFVETIGRSPSGKVDYARHRRESLPIA